MTAGHLQTESAANCIANASGHSVLLLAPQIYAHGGVQSYMRRLAVITSAYCDVSGRRAVSLAIGRRGFREADAAPPAAPAVIDALGSKPRLLCNALAAAYRNKPLLAVVGHIGLGPVALALQSFGLLRSYVVVLHGIEAWKRVAFADRLAARHAVLAVATTGFTARRFAETNGYPIDRIAVVPLAVEEAPVPPLPVSRRGEMRVLTVGRLARCERYKGIDYLIDAVTTMARSGVPVSLDIVGDGDDADALKARAAATGVPYAVRFHGAVSDEHLQQFYRSCDVFAMPSRNEGFGIVFLEAMRHGKPCIGGRHGGTPEVIEHGHNGFLVEHGDVGRLLTCLRDLHSNDNLRHRLGVHAYETVMQHFQFSRMQANWFSVLDAASRQSGCAA